MAGAATRKTRMKGSKVRMILCCGEALIDLIPEVEGAEKRVPHVGGAVLNTAIALGRLGQDVGMLTGVSSDEYGAMIAAQAEASHVNMIPSVRSDRPTTLAIVTLKNGQASYEFRDDGSATRMIGAEDLPDLANATAFVFGGISLIHGPVADTFADLCVGQSAHATVMVDVNIRPTFITDEKTYRSRTARMLASADILKVSDEDLAWLYPSDDELSALSKVSAAGPAFVVVTKGGDGAIARLSNGETVTAPAAAAQIVDTVGAGDTFNAGLLAALSEKGLLTKKAIANLTADQARDALGYASRVAAVTVSRAGANPPWAHEVPG